MAWRGGAGEPPSQQPGGPSSRRHLPVSAANGRAEGPQRQGSNCASSRVQSARRPSPTLSPGCLDACRCEDRLRARHTGGVLATRSTTPERATGGGHSGRDWRTRSRRPDPSGAHPTLEDWLAGLCPAAHPPRRVRHPRLVAEPSHRQARVEGNGSMFIGRTHAGCHVRCFGRMAAQNTIPYPREERASA